MAAKADGIGYCLHSGANVGAVDLDKCYDAATGKIAPWAQALIDRAPKGTYLEVTVSGTGLRLIGTAVGKYLNRKYPAADKGSFELYRNSPRYITVSGLAIRGADGPMTNIDDLLDT
jgi:primase-polymerase (primpol)-like protein